MGINKKSRHRKIQQERAARKSHGGRGWEGNPPKNPKNDPESIREKAINNAVLSGDLDAFAKLTGMK